MPLLTRYALYFGSKPGLKIIFFDMASVSANNLNKQVNRCASTSFDTKRLDGPTSQITTRFSSNHSGCHCVLREWRRQASTASQRPLWSDHELTLAIASTGDDFDRCWEAQRFFAVSWPRYSSSSMYNGGCICPSGK